MSFPPIVRIDLNPEYAAELSARGADLERSIRSALPWILTRLVAAGDPRGLAATLESLGDREGPFRAFVGCELLGRAGARPDVRAWLCEYLGRRSLSAGARYQLANLCASLGAEARRAGDAPRAAALARRGLAAVADLPARAVTASLYYNLGAALTDSDEPTAALEAFADSADVDELIGRHDEAARTRAHAASLGPARG